MLDHMIEHTDVGPRARSGSGRSLSRTAGPLCGLAILLLLGACAPAALRRPGTPRRRPPPSRAMRVVGNDPVVAFAARAQPGSADRVVLAGGQAASVRVTRAYISANGGSAGRSPSAAA
jgi:hypothetical protein